MSCSAQIGMICTNAEGAQTDWTKRAPVPVPAGANGSGAAASATASGAAGASEASGDVKLPEYALDRESVCRAKHPVELPGLCQVRVLFDGKKV